MSKPVKYRVYEVVCRDKNIKDRYIGYTSMPKKTFIECQQGIVRDKETGLKKDLGDKKQPPSRLQQFVSTHGDWDNWDFRVFGKLIETSYEANLRKEVIISRRPGVYTLNIYKTDKQRAAPVKKPPPDIDLDFSDEESIATDE